MNGRVNKQIVEQAANWFVDFRVGDTDARHRQEFHDWLRRSPEHIQAYLDIAMTYAEIPAPEAKGDIDVEGLIRYARSSDETNVVRLESPIKAPVARASEVSGLSARAKTNPASKRVLAIAASVVMTIALGTWLYIAPDTYSTGIGEQRSLVLTDGSSIQLNSRSRVSIRYTEDERRIVLLEGQALFEVAKDTRRPFTVHVNDTQVRAIGTRFDVYRKQIAMIVTVVEGKVSVLPAGEKGRHSGPRTDAPGLMLTAGEQLQLSALISANDGIHTLQPLPVPRLVDTSAATAWTQRQLIFENASLPEVAEEFNRYSARPIIIETDAADSFHISGTYSSTNPESLLRFLRVQPGIHLIESDNEIRVARE